MNSKSENKKQIYVRCEQCGNLITKEDYDLYGCVCFNCAVENLGDD